MNCPNCHTHIAEGAQSCSRCGQPVINVGVRPSRQPLVPPQYVVHSTASSIEDRSARLTRNWIIAIVGVIVVIATIAIFYFLSPASRSNPFSNGVTNLDSAAVEAEIQQGLFEDTSWETTVQCPELMSGTQGTVWKCLVTTNEGTEYFAEVTLQSKLGEYVWELVQ